LMGRGDLLENMSTQIILVAQEQFHTHYVQS
jgi:hypothetical protein